MPPIELSLGLRTGAYPVQFKGTINGKALYFRARWDRWSFGIADSHDDAVGASGGEDIPGSFRAEGTYGEPGEYQASWMPYSVALAIIGEQVGQWVVAQEEWVGAEEASE